jgi:hypothetical protein
MYDRVLQVFPDKVWSALAPQQQTLAENAMARVREREGDAALTLARLEGIKELVTQHLWSPALSEASKSLPPLEMATSAISALTPPRSSDSAMDSQASAAPTDLQNLPVDPALAPMREMDARSQESTTAKSPASRG